MQDAGYKFGGYNIKHDEYEKDGVTIEMHRDVLFRLSNAYDYFADIWERAIHAKGKQYIYEMSLETLLAFGVPSCRAFCERRHRNPNGS